MKHREIDVEELKRRRNSSEPIVILDVREPWETEIVALAGSTFLPMRELPRHIGELDPESAVAVICHSGQRSTSVAGYLAQQGFASVFNVTGGIDEYARRADPTVNRYQKAAQCSGHTASPAVGWW